MSQRHPMAIVAGAATMLSAFPLFTVYASSTWVFYTALAVGAVIGSAMLVRLTRAPLWVQLFAMLGGLLIFLTLAFPSGGEIVGLIPTGDTFRHFNALFAAAGQQIRDEAVPVPDHDGLILLTAAGVGLVAILVDLAVVGIRRPALAGLPMLAIYAVPVAVLADGLSIWPFGFAAAGFLWLLVSDSVDRVRRFGRRFTGEGRDVDVWEASPLASAGRRLGVIGVAIAMIAPLAIPGMTSGLLERFGPNGLGPAGSGGGPGGGSSSVNLTALLKDSLTQDKDFVMLKVRTSDPSPYYLRFAVADQIIADGFANKVPINGAPVADELPDFVPPAGAGVTSRQYIADVQVVDFDMSLAPTYQRMVAMAGLGNSWFFESGSGQVFSRRENINGKQYRFEYVHTTYTATALRETRPTAASDNSAYSFTEVPAIQEVTDLVGELTAGKSLQYDRVRAIYEHFSPNNGFRYSLATEPGNSGNAIVDFLHSRTGFCVQYAAAMAWLVRVAGYPARVGFGFTRGAGAVDGVYTLTNRNLHAWTEVYFPGIGWVPFDATPASGVVGAVRSSWAMDPTEAPDGGTDNPDDELGPTASAGPLPGDRGFDPGEELFPSTESSTVPTSWLAGAGGVVLVALLALPALRRRSLRRRRRARTGELIVVGTPEPGVRSGAPPELIHDPSAEATARRDAHAAWAELLDTMVDYGVVVDDAETPRSTASRLARLDELHSSAHAPAELLAMAEERARYALTPLRPTGLDEANRVVREALAARVGRWQRLSASLLPRSVLQGWRNSWITWNNRVIGIAARTRRATRIVNPRRLLPR